MKEKTTNEEMNQVLKEMIQGGSSASDNDRRAGRSYLERLSLQTEDGIAVSSPAPDEQPFSSDLTSNYHRLYPLYRLHKVNRLTVAQPSNVRHPSVSIGNCL